MKFNTSPLLVLLCGAALGGAVPLRAQDSSSSARMRTRSAERVVRRVREAQLAAELEQLRRQLDDLEHRRRDAERLAEQLQNDLLADSVRHEFDVAIDRAVRTLGRLETSVGAQSADATAMRRAVAAARAQAAVGSSMPAPVAQSRGWMGINYLGAQKIESSNRGVFIYHYDYPVVVSVEPASPAERAGLMTGDTIIAYDGKDVRNRTIALGKQLKPGTRLVVRVRRAGETLDVPVAIERRPAAFVSTYSPTLPPSPVPLPPEALSPPRPPRAPRVLGVEGLPPDAAVAPPVAPTPSVTAVFGGWTTTVVAGAEVARMTPSLRDVFGVPSGVLVLSVAPGSPAAAGGLRSGDVIQRVNDTAVASPQAFQRAVLECTTKSAKVDIVRRKKGEQLTLHW